MSRLSAEAAQAFKKRWQLVNTAELEELRKTTMEEKLKQTAALMASYPFFDQGKDADKIKKWDRWRRLRARLS